MIIHLVFSNFTYLTLAVTIFVSMTVTLLLLSEYIFIEPFLIGHVPPGSEIGFILIITLGVLAGLVIPMNIYRIKTMRTSKQKMSGGILGSTIGAVAGLCSCGPVGFTIISTFGSIGATATALLTFYEIPIRVASIIILIISYFTTVRSIQSQCQIHQ